MEFHQRIVSAVGEDGYSKSSRKARDAAGQVRCPESTDEHVTQGAEKEAPRYHVLAGVVDEAKVLTGCKSKSAATSKKQSVPPGLGKSEQKERGE